MLFLLLEFFIFILFWFVCEGNDWGFEVDGGFIWWSLVNVFMNLCVYCFCFFVMCFGKMNWVGVGVVVIILFVCMIIFFSFGEVNFNMFKLGEVSKLVIFCCFVFDFELKLRVIFFFSWLIWLFLSFNLCLLLW